MKGVICRRHVLAHPLTTIHCFGWQVFLRALTAGPDRTFLSIVAPTLNNARTNPTVSSFIEQCVSLEVRAGVIYRWLARKYEASPPLARFFSTMARQEQDHAELLELCRGLAGEADWKKEDLERWQGAIPKLEDQMAEIEKGLEQMVDTTDILHLVIDVEGSEINQLFRGVVTATDSEFVRKFKAFQNAEKEHIDYICEEIPRLETSLAGACTELHEQLG